MASRGTGESEAVRSATTAAAAHADIKLESGFDGLLTFENKGVNTPSSMTAESVAIQQRGEASPVRRSEAPAGSEVTKAAPGNEAGEGGTAGESQDKDNRDNGENAEA